MKLQAKQRLIARQDATSAFDPGLIERMTPVDYKSRYKLVNMSIRDFLKMARPGHDKAKERDVKDLVKKGVKFNSVPFLTFDANGDDDARVTGHEGRHRARELQAQGYTHMPVELRGPIRWSEQADPKRFDYRESWPEVLVSEDGTDYIPFPVPREEATHPYKPVTS